MKGYAQSLMGKADIFSLSSFVVSLYPKSQDGSETKGQENILATCSQ